MLLPTEFTVGTLCDAKPPSLMLPISEYGSAFLIGESDLGPTAVFLEGQHLFRAFGSAQSKNWEGLIISNVELEVDETSAFLAGYSSVFGAVERSADKLSVNAKSDQYIRSLKIITTTGLPPIANLSAGFTRWNIFIRRGDDKYILRHIDALANVPA